MPLTPAEIHHLAATHYPAEYGDDPSAGLFVLLLAVADEYVKGLEAKAGDDPAPYLGGTTPLDAAMFGLRDNLEMLRGE